MPGLNAYERLS